MRNVLLAIVLCGSALAGPTAFAQATQPVETSIIDFEQGTPFSSWVRGQCPYRWVKADQYQALWALTRGAMGRGVGGGLDADNYDWRDINSGCRYGKTGGQFTTLEFLQHARDYDAAPLVTANMFGGGYLDENKAFVSVTDNPDGLAADYVRYTNVILPNYHRGDESELTGETLRVYNSIRDWGDKPKLLAPGEQSVPRVEYWEIGNEPEVNIPSVHADHSLSPTDYRDRYKLMAEAMRAVDPTIKFGPCLTNPAIPSHQWLPVLVADSDVQIDFVSYHPYDGGLKSVWEDSEGMAAALRKVKPKLLSKSAAIRSIMDQAGRSEYELFASEWNPVSWEAPSQMQSSMANAIGIVESCFTFAEDGVRAANFWQEPQNKAGPAGAFAGLVNDMGDVLVTTSAQMGYGYETSNFRFYVTKNAQDDSQVMIWGLNFDDHESVTINLGLTPPCQIVSATFKRFGKARGRTTLTSNTDLAWSQHDVTSGFNAADFPFTVRPAEISVLVLQFTRTSPTDEGDPEPAVADTEPAPPVAPQRDADIEKDVPAVAVQPDSKQVREPSVVPVSWQLRFRFEDPRRVSVFLPGRTEPVVYWYMLYRVENPGPVEVDFLPRFELVTDTLKRVPSQIRVSPEAFRAIQRRSGNPLLVPPERAVGRLLCGRENARHSVAIWPDFDPQARGFRIYVGGLSGESRRVPNPAFDPSKVESETNKRYYVVFKTLEIPYKLPAGPATRMEVRPVRESDEQRWIMR